MSKPLGDLWERDDEGDYIGPEDWCGYSTESMADFCAEAKRFTDTELAAEYHAMDSLCRREQWIESVRGDDYSARELQGQTGMYDRLNTIYRLATTPSYDEAAS